VILGFYTLSMASAESSQVAKVLAKKLPKYAMPVALIGRLAVDQRAQGRRLGEKLLIEALRRVVEVAGASARHRARRALCPRPAPHRERLLDPARRQPIVVGLAVRRLPMTDQIQGPHAARSYRGPPTAVLQVGSLVVVLPGR
jgi:GNAT superfamily N-acetyltransferase